MYSAKAERDGHRFYAHGQDRHSVSRLSMVGDFRRALEKDDEIIVHFHPIVDLGTGQVHGAEALVRWQHPELGLLQPAAFLEIVEQTGLIGAMTTRVLEQGDRRVRRLARRRPRPDGLREPLGPQPARPDALLAGGADARPPLPAAGGAHA